MGSHGKKSEYAVTIFRDGRISIDGNLTGYLIRQEDGKVVVRADIFQDPTLRIKGSVVKMPRSNYNLDTTAGTAKFAEDFRSVWEN